MIVLLVLTVGLTLWAYAAHVQTAGHVYEDRTWLARDVSTSRPLTAWSWQHVNSPQASHALNVGLHLWVCVLAGLLAWQLGLSALAGAAVGSLLAVHPVTVEAVAYAASRAELFAALSVLGACLLAIRGSWWLVVPVVLLGLASKETAAVALLLIPLARWATRQTWKMPALTCACALAALISVTGGWLRLVNLGEAAGMQETWLPWLLVQSTAAVRLMGLTLWPFFGGFTVDYDYDAIGHMWRYGALLTLIGVAGLAWTLRRQRLVAFGLAWMLLAVLPRLLVQTPRSYLNEHQWLLAGIGLLIAVMVLVDRQTV